MAITSFMAIAALLIFAVPATSRSQGVSKVRSVTKIVTAIGVMILVEEGKVGLNDPIEKYLPDFKTAT
ncbi:MAG TPA: serine hydrolase domain-containing protein [Pyrinomonadaceae bacterium]|nr:serine hydrolase domain-containing protein [Pyrinomonadaceae bacterium]